MYDLDYLVQIGGGGAGVIAFIWWVVKSAHRRIDAANEEISATKLDLANHKIYSEGTYVKGSSLDRVHDRIDAIDKKQDEVLKILIGWGKN